jgi:hypothetical protein
VRRLPGHRTAPGRPHAALARTRRALTRRPARAQDDLWIIIKGKVYDITSYVEEHPGGETILRNAGCAARGKARVRRRPPPRPPRAQRADAQRRLCRAWPRRAAAHPRRTRRGAAHGARWPLSPARAVTRRRLFAPRSKDSTKGFMGPQHPSRVFDIIDDFLIGTLVPESAKDK